MREKKERKKRKERKGREKKKRERKERIKERRRRTETNVMHGAELDIKGLGTTLQEIGFLLLRLFYA